MYIALWVVTGIFAALFAMAGSMKVVKPYAGIREQMEWVETVTPAQLKGIGIVEVLGAIGIDSAGRNGHRALAHPDCRRGTACDDDRRDGPAHTP